MLKETTGAFDGGWTHDLHIPSQTGNPLRPATPYNMSRSRSRGIYLQLDFWSWVFLPAKFTKTIQLIRPLLLGTQLMVSGHEHENKSLLIQLMVKTRKKALVSNIFCAQGGRYNWVKQFLLEHVSCMFHYEVPGTAPLPIYTACQHLPLLYHWTTHLGYSSLLCEIYSQNL